MSQKKNTEKPSFSRKYLYFAGIIIVIVVALFIGTSVLQQPGPATVTPPAETTAADPFSNAGALYSKSVDLANAGNYKEALETADKALALNVSALTPLIQANRAGILVMLGRNNEAIDAADAALGVGGNLTTVHAYAWYSKGDALKALGRTAEANAAYANATSLDPSLVRP